MISERAGVKMFSEATLDGARIWLSGSVPEKEFLKDGQADEILKFVSDFAKQIFKRGGHIIHGSHPSFTPILLAEAKRHQEQGGRKDCLILAVSRYWSKNTELVPVDEWRKVAIVYETPEDISALAREKSLETLRNWMVARCDAIVVVGGKWWHHADGIAGIPLETSLAVERGIPCFLLGGLGGIAKSFIEKHHEILYKLKNGFDVAKNYALSTNEKVSEITNEVCEQLERLPLVRGRGTDGASFRILSLDGGGLKGAFTASVIATWEKHTGLKIVDYFDIIAGTSTGGILAIGLGLGFTGQELLDFYQKRGPIIFPVSRFHSKIFHQIKQFIKPKYSQEVLFKELQKVYNQNGVTRYLKDAKCRLVIPSYHAIAGVSHLFRTPHHKDLTADAETEAACAALATASAPTYFNAAKIANAVANSSYFDGGVWANAPAMAAIIEAVCFLRIPIERIEVLSVGTTDEPFTVSKKTKAGIIQWNKKLIDLLMNAQQESSLKLAKQLVGSPRFLRVNEITPNGKYKLDSVKEINDLASLGERKALEPDILGQVKARFLNGVPVEQWESFHK
jgi:patatin-like phospholipase/acyl hydrolase